MKKEFLAHKWYYLILFTVLLAFVVLFLLSWPNLWLQRLLIVMMVSFYFFWGILTHTKTDKITERVVKEYLGVSFLAGAILLMITFY